MREIIFRGKRIDNGEWVQGDLIHKKASVGDSVLALIVCSAEWDKNTGFYHLCNTHKVIPETIGQYTGLNVGNEKLFEGDIVEWHEDYDDTWGYSHTTVGRSVVIWDKENFCWAFKTDTEYIQSFNDWNWDNSYIIGNIHDNPELLKVGDNNE